MINNILKKIEKANEVQKIELAKHEVELASVDDLQKQQIKAAKELEEATAQAKAFAASIDKVVAAYRKGLLSSQAGIDISLEVIELFKKIGIPTPGYVVNWQKEFQANARNTFNKIKTLEAAKKSIG